MLARYQMKRRGKPGERLPEGIRQDTRRHTKHPLRPGREMVDIYLATPAEEKGRAWKAFERAYIELIRGRYAEDRAPFDKLAKLAEEADVCLGCSCPTKKNPDVWHCHTVLALGFMKRKYPRLDVRFPDKGT
jgi:hypothetical protein